MNLPNKITLNTQKPIGGMPSKQGSKLVIHSSFFVPSSIISLCRTCDNIHNWYMRVAHVDKNELYSLEKMTLLLHSHLDQNTAEIKDHKELSTPRGGVAKTQKYVEYSSTNKYVEYYKEHDMKG
jgi:hypothetical protein